MIPCVITHLCVQLAALLTAAARNKPVQALTVNVVGQATWLQVQAPCLVLQVNCSAQTRPACVLSMIGRLFGKVCTSKDRCSRGCTPDLYAIGMEGSACSSFCRVAHKLLKSPQLITWASHAGLSFPRAPPLAASGCPVPFPSSLPAQHLQPAAAHESTLTGASPSRSLPPLQPVQFPLGRSPLHSSSGPETGDTGCTLSCSNSQF